MSILFSVRSRGSVDKRPLASVITGDIIGSSKLSIDRRKDLYREFQLLSSLLKQQYPLDVLYDISNFRGDGWQIICNRPKKAVEITLFIRMYFRFTFQEEKLDTRAAIGVGTIDFIPPQNISAGDGDAYLQSGHLLESFREQRMGIEFSHAENETLSQAIKNGILLLDLIATSWSSGQCQSVFWALHGLKQKEIAANWKPNPITQASVSVSLKTAGWNQIKESLDLFEGLLSSLAQ